MAKTLITTDIIIDKYLITGLGEGSAEAKAFRQYLRSEAGAMIGDNIDEFDSFTVSGKGEKAKVKVKRGEVEFKGETVVTTATLILGVVSAIRKVENSTGYLAGKLDCRETVEIWATRWREKQAAKAAKAATEPEVENEENKEREQEDKNLVNV